MLYTQWKRDFGKQLHIKKRGGVRIEYGRRYVPEKSNGIRLEIQEGGLFWVKGGGLGAGGGGGGVNNARHMHGPEGVLIKSADTSQIALPVLVCGVRYVLYVQVPKSIQEVCRTCRL